MYFCGRSMYLDDYLHMCSCCFWPPTQLIFEIVYLMISCHVDIYCVIVADILGFCSLYSVVLFVFWSDCFQRRANEAADYRLIASSDIANKAIKRPL